MSATKSLKKEGSELAQANKQIEILSNGIFKDELPTFAKKIKETKLHLLILLANYLMAYLILKLNFGTLLFHF